MSETTISSPPAGAGHSAHQRLVMGLAEHLDQGTLFKLSFVALFRLAAWGWLIGGVLLCVAGLIGDDGYFEKVVSRAEGFDVVTSLLGGLVGLVLCGFMSWLLYGLLDHRARDLQNASYVGMIDFVLGKAVPKMISSWGEVVFLLAALEGVLFLVAAAIGSHVYAPFQNALPELVELVWDDAPRMGFSAISVPGNYDDFGSLLTGGVTILVSGFMVLVGAYLTREIWLYAMEVASAFVRFLPRFAINLRIRQVGPE